MLNGTIFYLSFSFRSVQKDLKSLYSHIFSIWLHRFLTFRPLKGKTQRERCQAKYNHKLHLALYLNLHQVAAQQRSPCQSGCFADLIQISSAHREEDFCKQCVFCDSNWLQRHFYSVKSSLAKTSHDQCWEFPFSLTSFLNTAQRQMNVKLFKFIM